MVKLKNLLNKRWKVVALYAAVTIAVFGSFFYWATWSGSTDHIKSVADHFKAPSSWKISSETIVRPANLCITGPCPSMGRTWVTPKAVGHEALTSVLSESGWGEVMIENGCYEEGDVIDLSDACAAQGHIDGYDVTISTKFNDPILKSSTLTLYLR